ncbi:MAG: ribonuclease catalytic domain-containing protein, partial [archaeon]|nr:ribonuclease catalytic domain-containing protein [archaeon]
LAYIYEHNVDSNPFSQKIINSMPKEDVEFKCEEEELKKRMDLRYLNVCSIDPPGCKDIDDALHSRILENGNLEVGVHIADVTHYIKPNSEVDKIAAKNCNTVYLVHKRTDMLPKVLTENLCSLVGGKERLAFSVLWELDRNTLEILKVKYGKSVIRSRAALTYEKANSMMNDPNDNSELAQSIRNLNKVAKHLKNQRIEKGALILASNEMKFNLDSETNTINDICLYPTYETNSLVEEFMLLANVWVAKKIYECFPSCAILRRHPPPKEKELSNFIKIMEERGYKLDASNSLKLMDSLDKINRPNDPFFNKLIRSLLTRTMNQAKYFPSGEFAYEDFYHYGLAMEIYTHFTSPIRRYSDILVHRLLAAALEIDYLPQDMSNKYKSNKECDQMNKQNRVAFFCGKDSNYFSAYLFFNDPKRNEERKNVEIVIHNIDELFIKGISIKYGIESTILFNKVGGIKSVDSIKKIFELNNGEKINLFDHVIVEIETSQNNYRYEIKYNYVKKINI